MSQYVVIGTSPFHDTSIAIGPFRTFDKADGQASELTHRGWNIEIVTLQELSDIGNVTNDEE